VASAITLNNVSKNFGALCAVDQLSFEVEDSTCFGFLGPNGAGKTTMMKMLYGRCAINKDCDGSIEVFGYDPRKNELDIKYLAGVVPQEDNLDEELNVIGNLMIFSKFYSIPSAEAVKRIKGLLEFLELSEKTNSKIKDLSGGMKRRLVIARALLNKPRLLILDEPTTGLDLQVRHLIWDKLRQLKKQGTTILLTTHYMEEAFQICDTVLIMHKGRKIMQNSPRRMLADNVEKYVLELQEDDCGKDIAATADAEVRIDRSQDMTRLYSDRQESLRAIAGLMETGNYHLRQANLEDVFLKATGRGLNDKQ
jgi:lipooligosaccharide transport system ATP-binding protein